MNETPLAVRSLTKTYGGKAAVKDLSFEVRSGEVFGLLGPNGAGKTTTIAVVTTLEKPTAGTAVVFGHDVTRESLQARRRLGVVHQEVINSGFFNIEELLQFQSGFHGLRQNKDRIAFLLDRLGLVEHKHKLVRQLSGGMKRRLMIAKALVHSPRLLLLDEPTAGVDIGLRERLWNFVRELRQEGIAILLTTHYLEEAELLCDRVGIINHGVLETCGPTREIVSRFTQKKIILDLRSTGRREFLVSMHKEVGELLVENQIQPQDLKDIRIEEGTLEEAFRRVLAGPEVRP